MNERSSVLNAVEAARRIYQTPHPSASQVGKVIQKIESGVLGQGPQGGATTTVEAVVEYLARRESARATTHLADRNRLKGSSAAKHVRGPVVHLYRQLLKDYFLAVLLRRRRSAHSSAFGWTVIGTQTLMLVLAIIVLGTLTTRGLKPRIIPFEERTVQVWLTKHFGDVEIKSIKILDDQASTVRAVFSYRVNNRPIQSTLVVTLHGNQVVNVESDD